MWQRKHCGEAELPADTGSRRMTKADTDRKAGRTNAMIRTGCLIFLLVMTRMSTAAETLPAEEGEMEKISVRIVLRPEKEEGDPDPDLTEAVRTQIREQVGDDPDLLDRLCSCVEWTYAYDDEIHPPGEMRAAGESDILLTFAEDPEYVFEGWTFPDEGTSLTDPGLRKKRRRRQRSIQLWMIIQKRKSMQIRLSTKIRRVLQDQKNMQTRMVMQRWKSMQTRTAMQRWKNMQTRTIIQKWKSIQTRTIMQK